MKDSMPSVAVTSDSSEKHYPSLYLDWDSKYDLPDSGTMVIKFNKTSESNSKGKDKKPHQSVTLEITSIESVKGGASKAKSSSADDTGAALDKLKDEVESESDSYEKE